MEHHSEQRRDDQRDIALTAAQQEWLRCKPWIEAALNRAPGLEEIEDVEDAVANGLYSFWSGKNCACICEILQYRRKKVFNVVHGGGDLTELVEQMEPLLCEYARANGCTLIMGTGREGWKHTLKPSGYRFGWLVMFKDLRH